MYDAFDSFLAGSTWHTLHASDEERFLTALNKVVTTPGFNPEEMGEYMRQKVGARNADIDSAIDRYTSDAWAVYTYLKLFR
jgi:hypothetical protein